MNRRTLSLRPPQALRESLKTPPLILAQGTLQWFLRVVPSSPLSSVRTFLHASLIRDLKASEGTRRGGP